MAFQLEPEIEDYVLSHSSGYSPAARGIADETAALGDPAVMMLAKEQHVFFRFLARVLRARRVLDVGTFTGLSALAFAEGMEADGRVITIDRGDEPEWLEIARRQWARANVADRIDVRIAEAVDELNRLGSDGSEPFDVVFLDVDKAGGQTYFELALALLAPNGLLLIDNALWHRWILDSARTDDDTVGTRRLNEKLVRDARVETVLVPIADGLMLVRRAG